MLESGHSVGMPYLVFKGLGSPPATRRSVRKKAVESVPPLGRSPSNATKAETQTDLSQNAATKSLTRI